MEAKLFVNTSEDNFECKWDGKAFLFKPGEARILQTYKAVHFAKHFVNQELQKIGSETLLDPTKRQAILDKCLKEVEEQSTDMPDEDKVFEAQVKQELKKNKGGRPKKVVEPKAEEPKKVEEFEGLNE